MNTGLQDAYNLAWKLALVVSGRAKPALLDSYEEERIPVATRLLDTTDRAFSLVVSDNPLAGLLRTKVLARVAALAMTSERVQEFAFGTISQIGIQYRESPLSRTLPGLPGSAPQAGDRFPWLQLDLGRRGGAEDLFQALDDRHFTLLLFGEQSVPRDLWPGLAGMLDIISVPSGPANERELATHEIPESSFYLVRPDGYIALAGTRLVAADVTGLPFTT